MVEVTENIEKKRKKEKEKRNSREQEVHKEFLEFLTKQMGREASSWADTGRVGVHQLCPHISMKMFIQWFNLKSPGRKFKTKNSLLQFPIPHTKDRSLFRQVEFP